MYDGFIWRYRISVSTRDFHSQNRGSIPRSVTTGRNVSKTSHYHKRFKMHILVCMLAPGIWMLFIRYQIGGCAVGKPTCHQNSFDKWKTVCCDKNAYPQDSNLTFIEVIYSYGHSAAGKV